MSSFRHTEEPAPVLAPNDAILPPATKDQKKGAKKAGESSDLSNFRTPSGTAFFIDHEHFISRLFSTGLYYCSICNISVNSESQFKTHSESKKHKAKSSTAKVPEPPAAPKNDSWKPTLVKEEEVGTSSSFGLVPDNTEFTSD
jgi:Zinc-finger of C2H2 type